MLPNGCKYVGQINADGEPRMWCDRRFLLLIHFLCYVSLSDGFEDGVFAAIVFDPSLGTKNTLGFVRQSSPPAGR